MKYEVPLYEAEEMFTHRDDDGSMFTLFTGVMGRWCKKYLPNPNVVSTVVPMNFFQVDYIRSNMGIEQERVDRITPEYLFRPIIGIVFQPDSPGVIIVDGNHRIIKCHELKIPCMAMHVFQYPFWKKFKVADGFIKEEDLKKSSRMLEPEMITKSAKPLVEWPK